MSTSSSLSDADIFTATRECIEAWNTLDLEATLATYTDDVSYRDPKTRGTIEGKDSLRRYLKRFFEVWDMQFRVVEDRRIAGADAQVCLWDADIRRVDAHGNGKLLTVSGMDIIHVVGGQLSRDHAFMDTALFSTLSAEA